ncbi:MULTISPECIES: hypothetical protein [unclassified Coleofasciculus]|nr:MULTISPECIES: hypothetical protein [unclassified Coleofasciculus]
MDSTVDSHPISRADPVTSRTARRREAIARSESLFLSLPVKFPES